VGVDGVLNDDPGRVVESFLASFATADVDRIADHVADRFVNEHTSLLGSSLVGRDEYRARLSSFLASFEGLRYEAERLIVDGDHVAVPYVLRARWQGTHDVELRGMCWFEVRDGLIVRRVDYWDSAEFVRQTRPPPEPA
jgi:ketosteroid isomerase-like protein